MRRFGRWLWLGLLLIALVGGLLPADAANTLKHGFVCAKPDPTDVTLVNCTHWNAEHAFAGGATDQVLVWDAAQSDKVRWTNVPPLAVAKAGDTITGLLTINAGGLSVTAGTVTLPADPTSALHAATKQYVDAQVGGVREIFRGLHLRTHPDSDVAASKVMLVRADEIVLDTGVRVAGWDRLVADITVSGAGGLDTGSEVASTWYEVYAIRKSSDGTKNLLLHRAKDYFEDESETADDTSREFREAAARTKAAEGFKVDTAGKLEFIDLKLLKAGSPTGNVWMTIETDSAGNPSGSLLCAGGTSDKFDVANVATTAQVIRVVFRDPCTTVAATQYHAVLNADYAISVTNRLQVRGKVTSAYANGVYKEFDGSTWTAPGSGTLDNAFFKIFVTRNDTAVTMPTGYDQKAKIGYVRNDASSNFRHMRAKNRLASEATGIQVHSSAENIATLRDMSTLIPPGMIAWYGRVGNGTAADQILASGVPDGFAGSNNYAQVAMVIATSVAEQIAFGGAVITEYQAIYTVNNTAARTFATNSSQWEW